MCVNGTAPNLRSEISGSSVYEAMNDTTVSAKISVSPRFAPIASDLYRARVYYGKILATVGYLVQTSDYSTNTYKR